MNVLSDLAREAAPSEQEPEAVSMFNHPPLAAPAARWRPRSSVLRVRSVLYLLGHDCFAIAISFVGVAGIQRSVSFDDRWLTTASLLLPIYVLIAFNAKAYAPAMLQDPFDAIRRGAKTLIAALCALLVIAFYVKSSDQFSRLEFAGGSATALFLLSVGRYFFVRHLTAIVGGNPFSSILILDGDEPRPAGEFSIVMMADAYFDPDSDDPAMYDRLAKMLETADRVVIACPIARRRTWAKALRGANIQGEVATPELADLSPLGLGCRGGSPSVIVATGPLNLMDRCVKRVFDLAIAIPAMVFVMPFLLLTAICIKLDTRGSVLFKQTRIGRGNRLFTLYKFRSMRVETSDGKGDALTIRDDDRVTRVGRFIRKTSIDELPQLINIITGQMSIVGPRPHALGAKAASKLYWEVDQRYWHRHATKPGLTGLAQIRGFRGNTFEEVDLQNRLHSDLEYLEKWSVWSDIQIILMTVRVLVHRNAF